MAPTGLESLRIPYALLGTDGATVAPGPSSERRADYRCPECHEPVILRMGEQVRPHFAHKALFSNCPLMGESWQHVAAKHLVWHETTEWLEGRRDAPVLLRKCARELCRQPVETPLPRAVAAVRMERTVPDGGTRGFRPDVLFLGNDGAPLFAIEILHSHAVDDAKALRLNAEGLKTFEMEATEVLESGDRWPVLREWETRPPGLCRECNGAKTTLLHRIARATRREVVWRTLPASVNLRGQPVDVPQIADCPRRCGIGSGRGLANFAVDCRSARCPGCVQLEPGTRDSESGIPRWILCDGEYSDTEGAYWWPAADRLSDFPQSN